MIEVAQWPWLVCQRSEHAVHPAIRNRVLSMERAEQRTRDGAAGVGVAAAVHDVQEPASEVGCVDELPEGEAEGDPHEALLLEEVEFGTAEFGVVGK